MYTIFIDRLDLRPTAYDLESAKKIAQGFWLAGYNTIIYDGNWKAVKRMNRSVNWN